MANWTTEANPFGPNHVPTLEGWASDNSGPVPIAVDKATGELLVSSAGPDTYIERYDIEGTTIYTGTAIKGSASSTAAWTITKYSLSDMTAATALLSPTNAIWDNRATSVVYS